MRLEQWYAFCTLHRSLSDDIEWELPSNDDAPSESALISLIED
jgi:hypothetical protein